jgi:hypothetical protein
MLETKPEDIFGIVDEAIDRIEKTRVKPTLKKKPSSIPKVQIKKSQVPDEMHKVDAGNVVYVPESELRKVATRLRMNTNELNTLLLKQLMPLLLSYQTATNYTSAALKEGLDVDVAFDPGLADCIKHVGYLNVVMHFVRKSKLPVALKKRFMSKFSDLLAERSIIAMVEENKAEDKRVQMRDLQAVVYSRNTKKAEVKSPTVEEKSNKTVGVRRSRNK